MTAQATSSAATPSAGDPGPELAATVTIAASPARVWALVSDLERMSDWSPQVVKTRVLSQPVKVGTRFVNVNHQGLKHWPTTAKVVRYEPEREIAFRITENRTIWSFRLEAADSAAGGTLLTQRRETPDGISLLSKTLTKSMLGGMERFEQQTREDMRLTLERIKTDAEAGS